MHLLYSEKNGTKYASAVTSKRTEEGSRKDLKIYLGKVIDAENLIFENRKDGLVTIDLETGVKSKADIAVVPKKHDRGRKLGSASFGDVYVLDLYLREIGLMDCIDGSDIPNKDTMKALMMFYLLTDKPNSYALDWYESSYASVLYPEADMDDRRLSEFLDRIGDTVVNRSFFKLYIPWLLKDGSRAFIIDSTGVPNAIHMPITAISNHNGDLSLETRLIFVCRKDDLMPLYYRYIPGNVVDTTTLTRTVDELGCMGVEVGYIVMDAGYCTLENMEDLILSDIDFLTRLKPNFKMYKDLVEDHVQELTESTRTLHKDRFMRVYSTTHILEGTHREVWLHLILDEDMKNMEDKRTFTKWESGKITAEQRDEAYATNGLFALVSSYPMDRKDVVPTYYERGGVEQLLDTGKSTCRLGEAAVHSEEVLRGKWLVQFVDMALSRSLQNHIKDRKRELSEKKRKNKDDIPGRNLSLEHALYILGTHHCDIFEHTVLPRETKSNATATYKLLGIKVPRRIDNPDESDSK